MRPNKKSPPADPKFTLSGFAGAKVVRVEKLFADQVRITFAGKVPPLVIKADGVGGGHTPGRILIGVEEVKEVVTITKVFKSL